MEKESSGYKGKVLNALLEAGCEVGDIIRITTEGKSYEGILIPRSETGEGDHIVVKLKSGYNVGVHVTSKTRIEKVGKGAKPSFASPPLPEQKPDLPRVKPLEALLHSAPVVSPAHLELAQ